MEYTINIAKDFDKSLEGLGKEFLDNVLFPKLKESYPTLKIEFDDIKKLPLSFLKDSFIDLANIIGASTCLNLLLNKSLILKTEKFKDDIKWITESWIQIYEFQVSCLIDDQRNINAHFVFRNGKKALETISILEKKPIILYIDYDLKSNLTGLDVLKELENKKKLSNIINITSTHPIGIKKIKNFLLDKGFIKIYNQTYFKK